MTGLGQAAEHALISLLALNGLRVSEATGADIEALGSGRWHRIQAITPKGHADLARLRRRPSDPALLVCIRVARAAEGE